MIRLARMGALSDRASAFRVFMVLEAGLAASFAISGTLQGVYLVKTVGLNPLQLVLVGSVMELSYFLLGIPTGLFADAFSRRLSVVIGIVLMGAATMLLGAVPIFAVVLGAWVLWGLGASFVDGAYEAWISDEVGEEGMGRAFLRGARIGYAGSLAGIAVAVALASVSLQLAVVAGGALTLAQGLAAALVMPERGYTAPTRDRRASLAALTVPARAGIGLVRSTPVLLLIVGISASWGMWSESLDRLWEAHFLRDVGLPAPGGLSVVAWFGILNAGTLVLGLLVSSLVIGRLETAPRERQARVLLGANGVLVGSALLFALAGSFALALAAFWLTRVTRSLAAPLFTTWLNRHIADPGVRATVNSITGGSDAIGQFAGGPVIGAVGTLVSIPAALVIGAVALAPSLGLYRRALRHGGEEPELENIPVGVAT